MSRKGNFAWYLHKFKVIINKQTELIQWHNTLTNSCTHTAAHTYTHALSQKYIYLFYMNKQWIHYNNFTATGRNDRRYLSRLHLKTIGFPDLFEKQICLHNGWQLSFIMHIILFWQYWKNRRSKSGKLGLLQIFLDFLIIRSILSFADALALPPQQVNPKQTMLCINDV